MPPATKPDSQIGTPPVVERLAHDTLVLPKDDVIELGGRIAAMAWLELRDKLDARKPQAAGPTLTAIAPDQRHTRL